MPIDRDLITAMHVQTMHHRGMHREHHPSVLFQSSTIGALLDGAYDGDVTFAELAEHGDLGLGTLDALDGEMIALDGRFYRADVDGQIGEIDPAAKTPFAVVVGFEAEIGFEVDRPTTQAELLAELDRRLPDDAGACAIRVDGRFGSVRARSVPRQHQPYRPLAEVISGQHLFDLAELEGSLVGFRFPDHSGAIEVGGYHLHFVDSARSRGGHVLDFTLERGKVAIDPSNELRIELPPGVGLDQPHLELPIDQAIRKVEGA